MPKPKTNTSGEAPAPKKDKEKVCPVTRTEFSEGAKPIIIDVGGTKQLMDKKFFTSGTFGWFVNGTMIVDIGGKPVKVSFQCQAYVPNSKDAGD